MATITVGYHQIRGLGAPLRMMCFYKGQAFVNETYGADMMQTWHAEKKPALQKQNACVNLPYIIDGDQLVTQSITCCLYLGSKLKIDTEANFVHNHTVLDQAMDLRSDVMKVLYPPPFGQTKEKSEFRDAATHHMANNAKAHLTKLEGFCRGPYMCGAAPESGDFFLFEMLDQHSQLSTSLGGDVLAAYPKLKTLHARMKEDPALAKYFQDDQYASWATNNPLITHFTGQADGFTYGNSKSVTGLA